MLPVSAAHYNSGLDEHAAASSFIICACSCAGVLVLCFKGTAACAINSLCSFSQQDPATALRSTATKAPMLAMTACAGTMQIAHIAVPAVYCLLIPCITCVLHKRDLSSGQICSVMLHHCQLLPRCQLLKASSLNGLAGHDKQHSAAACDHVAHVSDTYKSRDSSFKHNHGSRAGTVCIACITQVTYARKWWPGIWCSPQPCGACLKLLQSS